MAREDPQEGEAVGVDTVGHLTPGSVSRGAHQHCIVQGDALSLIRRGFPLDRHCPGHILLQGDGSRCLWACCQRERQTERQRQTDRETKTLCFRGATEILLSLLQAPKFSGGSYRIQCCQAGKRPEGAKSGYTIFSIGWKISPKE